MVQLKLVIKLAFKNIISNKLFALLILFSITIASSLFFSSISISDTIIKMQTERWRYDYGYTDIIIHKNWDSPSPFFNLGGAEMYNGYMEYLVGEINGYATYTYNKEKKGIEIKGIDIDDLNKITPISIDKQADLYPFEGRKIVISNFMAKKYNLKLEDKIDLNINGALYRFKICGISKQEGPFITDGESTTAVIPSFTASVIYNEKGKVNLAYIKLKDASVKDSMINLLRDKYNRYTVEEPFSDKEIKSQNTKVSTPFIILTLILTIMSIYIISSTFNIIIYERMPVLGTLRSIGATNKKIILTLFLESLIYGFIGGILSSGLGIGILYIMSIYTAPATVDGFKATASINPIYLLMSMTMAILISVIGLIVPIMKVSRISIKNIVLGIEKTKKEGKLVFSIIGIILFIGSLTAPFFIQRESALILDTLCLLAAIVGSALTIPIVCRAVCNVFQYIYRITFGNEGIIALNNLKSNKYIISCLRLLTMGTSILFLVNTLSHSASLELVNYYDNVKYDIYMSIQKADMALFKSIENYDGISDAYGMYSVGNVDLLNLNSAITVTQGINSDKFLDYFDIDIKGDKKAIINELGAERNILLTTRVRDKFDLKIGDTLLLGAFGRRYDYKVIGFFYSINANGSYALISEKNFKNDIRLRNFEPIYIKTDKNPDEEVQILKEKFAYLQPYLITKEQQKEMNIISNRQLYSVGKGFTVLTLILGVIGVFNNLMLNFLRRKKHLAVMRSLGMSKSQMIKMIILESLTGGVVGGSIGAMTGVVLVNTGQLLLDAIELPVNIHYSLLFVLMCVVCGLVTTIIASVVPAIKASKMNIVELLKNE